VAVLVKLLLSPTLAKEERGGRGSAVEEERGSGQNEFGLL